MIEFLLNVIWFLVIPVAYVLIGFIIFNWTKELYERHIRRHDYVTVLTRILHYVCAVLFVAADAALNIIVMSVWFWEFPKEFLVTTRCIRHKSVYYHNLRIAYQDVMPKVVATRQQKLAFWICRQLENIDAGHC